ncbi:MAG TPA: transporter substrate-binding domain-containing protein [Candidatus Nitrosotenuis sp.]|jgi:glutamate/aspartate transport system substrate-binding protein|nr:transporter substrate-binding domain-containing protein [Candidatus Nitrosotenuis sp.]
MLKDSIKRILCYGLWGISFSSYAIAGPVLDNIVAKKAIVLGFRESSIPYSFIDNEGKALGYSLDVCHKIIERINKEKNTTLTIQYQAVFPQTWLTLVQNGTVNMVCAGVTITPERLEKIKVTPINADTINPAVLANNTTISKKDDLKGKQVIVVAGTTGEKLIHRLNADEKFGIKIITAKDYPEAFLLLEQGRGDAIVTDKVLLAGEIAKSHNPKAFKLLDVPLNEFDLIGIMYSKDDSELEALIKAQVDEMKKDGSLFKLYDKWFVQPIGPKGINLNLPLSDAQKKTIEAAK